MKKILCLLILLAAQSIQPQGIFTRFIASSKNKMNNVKEFYFKYPKLSLGGLLLATHSTSVTKHKNKLATELEIAKNENRDILSNTASFYDKLNKELDKLNKELNIVLSNSIFSICLSSLVFSYFLYKNYRRAHEGT